MRLFDNIYKERQSLNSDGKTFHKYQQNKHSPLILTL